MSDEQYIELKTYKLLHDRYVRLGMLDGGLNETEFKMLREFEIKYKGIDRTQILFNYCDTLTAEVEHYKAQNLKVMNAGLRKLLEMEDKESKLKAEVKDLTAKLKTAEAAIERAMYHINWLAKDSKKYAGTDAWASAERARKEVEQLLSKELKPAEGEE